MEDNFLSAQQTLRVSFTFCPAPFCGAEELGQHAAIQGTPYTSKNLTIG